MDNPSSNLHDLLYWYNKRKKREKPFSWMKKNSQAWALSNFHEWKRENQKI